MAFNMTSRLDTLGTRMKSLNQDPEGAVVVRDENGMVVDSGSIVACIGRTKAADLDPAGVSTLRTDLMDFFVDVGDLLWAGLEKLPEPGWEFERGNGELFRVVSLQEMGLDAPPFEYVTANRTRLRVHTTKIG